MVRNRGDDQVVGQALARDCVQGVQAQRLFAHITMVFSLAPALAPVMGGYLSSYSGWRSVFWMLTVLSVGLIALCWRQLPETLPVASRQPLKLWVILANYARALSNGRFVLAISAIACAFGGFALYISSAASFVRTVTPSAPVRGFQMSGVEEGGGEPSSGNTPDKKTQ